MNKKIIVAGVAVALLAGGYMYLSGGVKKESDANRKIVLTNVKAQTVANSAQEVDRIYSGVLKPRFESQLAFQVGGKISERFVDRGDKVKKGQVLMKLDPKDVNLNLQGAQAALDKARSDTELAHTNLTRYKNLFEGNAVSKAQLDDMQNRSDAADSAMKQARSNFEEATRQLAYTELTADHDGIIAERKAEVEQVVQAGQVVLVVQQGEQMDVEINVPEQRVGDFRANTNIAAKAIIPAVSEEEFELAVRDVSPQADAGTRTYAVKFSFRAEPTGVASGMTATVDVVWRGENPPIMLPLPALYRTEGQPDSVWVLSGDRVFKRRVKLGEFGGNEVQVKEGLVPGEEVVVAGVQKLEEGQQVKKWTGTNE